MESQLSSPKKVNTISMDLTSTLTESYSAMVVMGSLLEAAEQGDIIRLKHILQANLTTPTIPRSWMIEAVKTAATAGQAHAALKILSYIVDPKSVQEEGAKILLLQGYDEECKVFSEGKFSASDLWRSISLKEKFDALLQLSAKRKKAAFKRILNDNVVWQNERKESIEPHFYKLLSAIGTHDDAVENFQEIQQASVWKETDLSTRLEVLKKTLLHNAQEARANSMIVAILATKEWCQESIEIKNCVLRDMLEIAMRKGNEFTVATILHSKEWKALPPLMKKEFFRVADAILEESAGLTQDPEFEQLINQVLCEAKYRDAAEINRAVSKHNRDTLFIIATVFVVISFLWHQLILILRVSKEPTVKPADNSSTGDIGLAVMATVATVLFFRRTPSNIVLKDHEADAYRKPMKDRRLLSRSINL